MRNHVRRAFGYFALAAMLLAGALPGCTKSKENASANGEPPAIAASDLQPPQELARRIDGVVEFSRSGRRLNSRDHAAWQVVHGVLAFGGDFDIEHEGRLVPAMDWLLKGEQLRGWNLRPGDKGVISVLEAGSKEGQGHPDQWLGYLSQTGLGLDEELTVGNRTYKIRDLLTQAQWDIYDGMEATWTLMALVTYLPLDATWTNKAGETWTTERVVAMEAAHPWPLSGNSCGGSHRLFGLALSVNRFLAEHGNDPASLVGGWKAADERLQQLKQTARQFQQPDGSFSTLYFERPATSASPDERINVTGHTFEVLATCMTQEELEQPWVVKAAEELCELLEQTQEIAISCGGLYHSAHGLMIYRHRRFGPPPADATRTTAKPAAAERAAGL